MNCMIDPNDNDMWLEAIHGKYYGGKPFTRREWDMLLGHCQVRPRLPFVIRAFRNHRLAAMRSTLPVSSGRTGLICRDPQAVCDFPACAFAPELIAAYPEAKVILTNRPVESWYTSCIGTIRKSMTSPLLYFMGFFDTEVMGKWTPMTRALFKAVFDNDFENNGRRVYTEHYDMVRRLVPKDRLLEYQIGEGWDRLCAFLEEDVPNVPYPNTNEAAAFRDRNWLRFKLSARRGAPKLATTGLGLLAVLVWSLWMMSLL